MSATPILSSDKALWLCRKTLSGTSGCLPCPGRFERPRHSFATSRTSLVDRSLIAAETLRFVVKGGEEVDDFFERFAGRRGEVGGERAEDI